METRKHREQNIKTMRKHFDQSFQVSGDEERWEMIQTYINENGDDKYIRGKLRKYHHDRLN